MLYLCCVFEFDKLHLFGVPERKCDNIVLPPLDNVRPKI